MNYTLLPDAIIVEVESANAGCPRPSKGYLTVIMSMLGTVVKLHNLVLRLNTSILSYYGY